MRTLKQINIKNCPNYFFDSMINIKNLDTNLLSTNLSIASNDSVFYNIYYFKNLDGVNSLYLVFNDAYAYFECIGKNKYLTIPLTEKNREALENYRELWGKIKDEIETIKGEIERNSVELIKYEESFIKIMFKSDDNLPLNKILNISVCVIVVDSVFQENDKYYLHIH